MNIKEEVWDVKKEVWIDSNEGWLRTYIVTANGVKLIEPEEWLERRGARIGMTDIRKYKGQIILERFKDVHRPGEELWFISYVDPSSKELAELWTIFHGYVQLGQCISLSKVVPPLLVILRLVEGKPIRVCLRFDVEVEVDPEIAGLEVESELIKIK